MIKLLIVVAGIVLTASDVRIVGGSPVNDPTEYPAYVEVLNGGAFTCGGTVVDGRAVLTAGHCVDQWAAWLGKYSVKTRAGVEHEVAGTWVHPNYSGAGDIRQQSDLALLYFDHELDVVAMPMGEEPVIAGQSVWLAGKGLLYTGGPLPTELYHVQVDTISNAECERVFGPMAPHLVCVGGYGRGACNGDSGGPMVSEDRSRLLGVTSFGARPCAQDAPSAYTRVQPFADYMRAEIDRWDELGEMGAWPFNFWPAYDAPSRSDLAAQRR